ncbi:MAG: hypothetical protein HYX97_03945 [Chloroflexi bacterium]|nr:hypothetical protein [Chloroflexota bacterium]
MVNTVSDVESGVISSSRKGASKPKSHIAYPWYDLRDALQLAGLIDSRGAGRLSAQSIAQELGSSITSGFFQAKLRAGRLFGLLAQEAEGWATTERARRALRPRSPHDRTQALHEAFQEVPLFKQAMQKFAGRPLPAMESFKNILEHEFGVIASRAEEAAKILLSSAREACLLQESGPNTYLSATPIGGAAPAPASSLPVEPAAPPAPAAEPSFSQRPADVARKTMIEFLISITSDDLDAMTPEEVQEVFASLGRIEAARRRSRGAAAPKA